MRSLVGAIVVLAALALPAHALEAQMFTRSSTAPHVPSLVTALNGVVAGSLHVNVTPNGANFTVTIGAGSWSGVNLSAVQAAVDAAPADTPATRAKAEKTDLTGRSCVRRAIAEVLLDEINVIRANIAALTLAPRTVAQMNTAIDAKIDALGCGG